MLKHYLLMFFLIVLIAACAKETEKIWAAATYPSSAPRELTSDEIARGIDAELTYYKEHPHAGLHQR